LENEIGERPIVTPNAIGCTSVKVPEGGSTGSADTAEGVKKRACGKTTANASASCNLPRSSGRSNCKRRSRGAFVEYILFTAEYVLSS